MSASEPKEPKTATSDLDQVIDHYAVVLDEMVKAAPNPSTQQIMKVLLARDKVEAGLPQKTQLSGDDLVKLVELDKRLKQQADTVSKDNQLADYRQSLKPLDSSWWWFLEPKPKSHKLDRFDWVWNGLTVACLVMTTSFVTSTAKTFSLEGFDLAGFMSTIGQGTLTALVAGGVLTDKGKQTAKNILESVNIPSHFHAEATFGFSAGVMLLTYGLYQNLPPLAHYHYFEQGRRLEEQKKLTEAVKQYKRALNFNPHDLDILFSLGKISEELGNLDGAMDYYGQGKEQNHPESIQAVGRILVLQELEQHGWTAKIDEAVAIKAEINLRQATESIENKLSKLGENAEDKEILEMYQTLYRININRGILHLANFDLERFEQSVNNQWLNTDKSELTRAKTKFVEASRIASDIQKEFPEKITKNTNQGTMAKCYQKIVEKIELDFHNRIESKITDLSSGDLEQLNKSKQEVAVECVTNFVVDESSKEGNFYDKMIMRKIVPIDDED